MYTKGTTLPATGLAGFTLWGFFGWLAIAVALITFGFLVLAGRKLVPARLARRFQDGPRIAFPTWRPE